MAPAYEVDLDLTDAGGTFRSATTVRFGATHGASTFIEATTRELHELVLNGGVLDPATASDGWRIRLDDLEAQNELRVVATCEYTNTGEGLHRFVDPVDDAVYLYTEFAVAEANRVYAVFDQPDLKASVRLHDHRARRVAGAEQRADTRGGARRGPRHVDVGVRDGTRDLELHRRDHRGTLRGVARHRAQRRRAATCRSGCSRAPRWPSTPSPK